VYLESGSLGKGGTLNFFEEDLWRKKKNRRMGSLPSLEKGGSWRVYNHHRKREKTLAKTE